MAAAGNRKSAVDRAWTEGLQKTASRPQRQDRPALHNRIGRRRRSTRDFSGPASQGEPDYIAIADGGDLLSFARVGLEARTYMDAGAFGCLGVGTPYAVAASLAYPGRQVVCVTGDGAFGINAMEIDTAVRHGAKIVVIVSNNAAWNIERLDQEANYGGRVVGTLLAHSDYAAMARAFGAHGERVEKPEDLPGAIERALANAPALVDVVTSQTVVSSDATKGLGFVPEFQALTVWDDLERKRRGSFNNSNLACIRVLRFSPPSRPTGLPGAKPGLLRLAEPTGFGSGDRRRRSDASYPHDPRWIAWNLWRAACSRRAEGRWPLCWPEADCSADAGGRDRGRQPAQKRAGHDAAGEGPSSRQRSRPPQLHGRAAERAVGGRHQCAAASGVRDGVGPRDRLAGAGRKPP